GSFPQPFFLDPHEYMGPSGCGRAFLVRRRRPKAQRVSPPRLVLRWWSSAMRTESRPPSRDARHARPGFPPVHASAGTGLVRADVAGRPLASTEGVALIATVAFLGGKAIPVHGQEHPRHLL